ncbi:MAG: flagellar hook-basal body complex protein FliE [Sphingomonadaceae bacterium]|uniref:flagellar hook-basal body complex protein FliE n=1 Tax=Thermaurantiacus sp. TaxID=2820283 RepID=UPI00298EDE9D|nr:flagellar hook-basal body complex protein FliE [Thermaurantiacus sp.]MCS6987014.1 flagellar hook-basal body complex protein FliE [Sphingomonadaceae bacterium]MDW8415648.1 flagellar hook-basal body complex protein FliE [Thermaurantiacus sp.]
MSGIEPRLGLAGVLALRARILEKSESLAQLARGQPATPAPRAADPIGAFGTAMNEALQAVNALQRSSEARTAAFERGETHDIAEVMLARQKASIAFEATLQARNRLLSAYRDILNMPI